jgi:hypothetical protein
MRRLPALLLPLLLGLAPVGEAVAKAPPLAPLLLGMASLSPTEVATRLKAGHADVDQALALRGERAAAWQGAVQERDEAAARVAGIKRQGKRGEGLDRALRAALVLDERANLARSRVMAAEAEVAKRGAALLRLYDAVLTLKRREVEGLAQSDARRDKAVRAYQGLAKQRDEVRRSLGAVLGQNDAGELDSPMGVRASDDDDVQALLEKADLARDLEERLLRRAEAISRRIFELAEERAVARDVAGLVRSQSLFDEDDMRLRVVSSEVRAQQQPVAPVAGGGGSSATALAPNSPSAVGQQGSRGDDGRSAPAPSSESAMGTQDFPGVSDAGGGLLPGGAAPDVGGTAVPRTAERAFLASPGDVDLAALLASGDLTLPELKALEAKLRGRAAQMRAQSKELRGEAEARARR